MPPIRHVDDSEIRDWLRAGAVPGPEDELTHILRYHENRLVSIESVLDDLLHSTSSCWQSIFNFRFFKSFREKKVEELREAQRYSRTSVDALRPLFAPIRHLPPELLLKIFKPCSRPRHFIKIGLRTPPFLFTVTQVCARWRYLSLFNPQLWSFLYITTWSDIDIDDLDSPEEKTSILRLMEFWISRSQGLPLSISVKGDAMSSTAVRTKLHDIACRWQHVKFEMPYRDENFNDLILCTVLARLESFKMYTFEGLENIPVYDISAPLICASKLRKFVWKNLEFDQYSPITLTWSQLTHLTLDTCISINQCLSILSMAVELTHVALSNVSDPLPDTISVSDENGQLLPRNGRITLAKLSSLVICAPFADIDIDPVFDALTLPVLNCLRINLLVDWPYSSSMVAFFRRSQFPLEILHLDLVLFTESDLIACLDAVQVTLKELSITAEGDGLMISNLTVDLLSDDGVGDVLCPNLENFSLFGSIACSSGRLANMVRSRFHSSISSSGEAHIWRGCAVPLKTMKLRRDEPEFFLLNRLQIPGLEVSDTWSLSTIGSSFMESDTDEAPVQEAEVEEENPVQPDSNSETHLLESDTEQGD